MVHMDGQSRERALGPESSAGNTDLTFRRETLAFGTLPVWMIGDHYLELGTQKAVTGAPNVDWKYYFREQAEGRLLLVVARDATHDAVGYVAMRVYQHPHYQHVLTADNDLHYLMPKHRGMGNGSKLLKTAEDEARKMGATLLIMRTKKGRTEHGHIFEKMGYELTDLVYTKDLTHDSPQAPAV